MHVFGWGYNSCCQRPIPCCVNLMSAFSVIIGIYSFAEWLSWRYKFHFWIQGIPHIKVPGSLEHPQVWHTDSENRLSGWESILVITASLHDYCMETFQGRSVSYLQPHAAEKKEWLRLFCIWFTFPGTHSSALGAMWTTSCNALNSNPTPRSCLFGCRPRGQWNSISAYCARRPLLSTGK